MTKIPPVFQNLHYYKEFIKINRHLLTSKPKKFMLNKEVRKAKCVELGLSSQKDIYIRQTR